MLKTSYVCGPLQRHGRVDDNLDAYKRRLQLYRELSLPLLKTLDEENRLKIVSGTSAVPPFYYETKMNCTLRFGNCFSEFN